MAKQKKKKLIYPSTPGRTKIPVTSHKHADKRVNIPTEELRDFVAEDEATPKKMLYLRDPSLDPQLVWKGKDEQDAKPLEVPVVPIYIQEKIHPQAIIGDLRRNPPSTSGRGNEGEGQQAELFADFNGIRFEEMIDFYHHEQNWSNRMILGDSLLVMTSLDTSRVALALARTRLMAAKFPYYHLADSSEGVMKEAEATGQLPGESRKFEHDIKKGFVDKRVPHITLKSIANNEEIDAIHAKWQAKLEPLRGDLNKLLNQKWEEWEIPRPIVILSGAKNPTKGEERDSSSRSSGIQNDKWSERAKSLLEQWWSLRRRRQKEVDDSIARLADIELLYDQPYEDNKRIRVTGPFTVESLSPHRVLSPADSGLDITVTEQEARKQQDFVSMILDNLRKFNSSVEPPIFQPLASSRFFFDLFI